MRRMTDHREWNELRRLYDADPGVEEVEARLRCPELHPVDIVRAVRGGAALTTAQREHFASCAVCQGWDRAARRSLGTGMPGRRPAAVGSAASRVRRWALGGGTAMAAAVIAGLTLFLYHASGATVLAGVLARSTALPVLIPPLIDDAGVIDRLRADVELARARRDEAMLRSGAAEPVLAAWQSVYNGLCDLGEWDEALSEVRAALDYCDNNPEGPSPTRRAVCLHDLGEIHAARGDFRLAGDAFARSIELRRQATDRQPWPVNAFGRAFALPVMYWRLANVALLEGDLERASDALRASDGILRDYFRAVREVAGYVPPPASVRLYDAFQAIPEVFRTPPAPLSQELIREVQKQYSGLEPSYTLVMMLRGHLYQAARLARLRGEIGEAERLIGEARAVPYYAAADEYHVKFFEGLEAARIAMAHRDFSRALREVDEAARHAGAIVVLDGSGPSKAALGPERLSELDFLRGAALLRIDADDPQGRRLVTRALSLPRAWEARIGDPQRRAAFRKRFETWYEVAERVGGQS